MVFSVPLDRMLRWWTFPYRYLLWKTQVQVTECVAFHQPGAQHRCCLIELTPGPPQKATDSIGSLTLGDKGRRHTQPYNTSKDG
jgi:hypothetical protein